MNHTMHLYPEPFSAIKSGQKTIELRLYDEKRRQLQPGDTLLFTDTASGETLRTRVLNLHRFESFAALYRALPLLKCGYTPDTVATADPRDMDAYYPPESQAIYGVVGIEIALDQA